jgi:hypothetical protein
VQYAITPATTALLSYTRTNDKLFGAVESDMDEAAAEAKTALSEVNLLSYGYTWRRYRFDVLPGAGVITNVGTQDSQTPWIGWQHESGPRTTLAVSLGPRIYQDSTKPFVLATLEHRYTNSDVVLGYERNETTLLGQVGRVESQTVYASLIHRVGQRLELRVAPGYAETSQQGFEVAIYRIGLQARYRITDMLYFSAVYDLNNQQVEFVDGSISEVSRNLVTLGFTFTYPGRNRAAAR